ncbi:MAG: ATP-binding cassette domain-containing protein [Candidatus Azobacteroides sp.]|jgi:cell division transport system ATP-binding protein|nr:ATP-binding cassette domain-containing protein [Candidatus Azobacteroides sp.]
MSDSLIKYENVSIPQKDTIVLREVNFELKEKEFLYVIGKVGSGKSTLLKSLYAEIPVTEGKAVILGYNLKKIRPDQIPFLRRNLGIVFQDFQLLGDRNVNDNLEFVLRSTGWIKSGDILSRIDGVLHQVGLPGKGDKMPHQLSGGEQQRIVIARALLNFPKIILADEPTGNLDPETAEQILCLLHEISKNGTAIIMNSHNYHLVRKYPSRMLRCEAGTLSPISIEEFSLL